jgi:hypothetical protein
MVTYTGYNGTFVKNLVAQHSPTITGTFSLSLEGSTFTSLANNIAARKLQSYINGIPGY